MRFEIFFFIFLLLFVASFQDFKRREIDYWLSIFILFSGFIFLISEALFYKEISYLVNFSFLLIFVFFVSLLLYYGKIFSGGDCNLLFSLTPFFVSINFFNSFNNFLFFLVCLFVLGSFYGFFWSFGVFLKNFSKVKDSFFSTKNLIFFSLGFLFLVLSFFFNDFLLIFIIFFFLFFSYVFLSLEKELFVKDVLTTKLREGDWLEKDIKLNGRLIRSSFEGLEKEEISFLKKNLKRVRIKDGIPYGFAFFISFIAFYFKDFIMEFLLLILIG